MMHREERGDNTQGEEKALTLSKYLGRNFGKLSLLKHLSWKGGSEKPFLKQCSLYQLCLLVLNNLPQSPARGIHLHGI